MFTSHVHTHVSRESSQEKILPHYGEGHPATLLTEEGCTICAKINNHSTMLTVSFSGPRNNLGNALTAPSAGSRPLSSLEERHGQGT